MRLITISTVFLVTFSLVFGQGIYFLPQFGLSARLAQAQNQELLSKGINNLIDGLLESCKRKPKDRCLEILLMAFPGVVKPGQSLDEAIKAVKALIKATSQQDPRKALEKLLDYFIAELSTKIKQTEGNIQNSSGAQTTLVNAGVGNRIVNQLTIIIKALSRIKNIINLALKNTEALKDALKNPSENKKTLILTNRLIYFVRAYFADFYGQDGKETGLGGELKVLLDALMNARQFTFSDLPQNNRGVQTAQEDLRVSIMDANEQIERLPGEREQLLKLFNLIIEYMKQQGASGEGDQLMAELVIVVVTGGASEPTTGKAFDIENSIGEFGNKYGNAVQIYILRPGKTNVGCIYDEEKKGYVCSIKLNDGTVFSVFLPRPQKLKDGQTIVLIGELNDLVIYGSSGFIYVIGSVSKVLRKLEGGSPVEEATRIEPQLQPQPQSRSKPPPQRERRGGGGGGRGGQPSQRQLQRRPGQAADVNLLVMVIGELQGYLGGVNNSIESLRKEKLTDLKFIRQRRQMLGLLGSLRSLIVKTIKAVNKQPSLLGHYLTRIEKLLIIIDHSVNSVPRTLEFNLDWLPSFISFIKGIRSAPNQPGQALGDGGVFALPGFFSGLVEKLTLQVR